MCVYKDQRKGMNGLEEGYKMLCYKMFQPFSKVITMCTFSTVLENKIKKSMQYDHHEIQHFIKPQRDD